MRKQTLIVATILIELIVGGVLLGFGASRSHTPSAAPLPSTTPNGSTSAAAADAGVAGQSSRPPSTLGSSALTAPATEAGLKASSIAIPALGVTATIGTSSVINGVLTPPRVPTEVGVWSGSAPLVSKQGEVTIAGHVNWAGMAPFAFGQLASLQPGDLVYTSDAHAIQTAWKVTDVAARSKSEPIDSAAFAGSTGPRRLALITCGGAFDAGAKSYDDNVYVYASPVT